MIRRTQKFQIYLANEVADVAFLSTDLRHNFGSNVGMEIGVMLRGKGQHKSEIRICLRPCLHTFLHDIHGSD